MSLVYKINTNVKTRPRPTHTSCALEQLLIQQPLYALRAYTNKVITSKHILEVKILLYKDQVANMRTWTMDSTLGSALGMALRGGLLHG